MLSLSLSQLFFCRSREAAGRTGDVVHVNRIGGEAVERGALPVGEGGVGEDFISFDDVGDDNDNNAAAMAAPQPAAAALPQAPEPSVTETAQDGNGEMDERSNPHWCPPGTVDRLRKLKSPLIRLHTAGRRKLHPSLKAPSFKL